MELPRKERGILCNLSVCLPACLLGLVARPVEPSLVGSFGTRQGKGKEETRPMFVWWFKLQYRSAFFVGALMVIDSKHTFFFATYLA